MRTNTASLAVLAGAALALLPAATASAKELAAVRACGAGGCQDVTAFASPAVLEGGPPSSPPRQGAPFYRLQVTVREGPANDRFTLLYVPSARKVRAGDGSWADAFPAQAAALDRIVRGIPPLPAAGLHVPRPSAPAPAADAGLPAAVWAFLAAGIAGVLAAGVAVARSAAARRRATRPATTAGGGAATRRGGPAAAG